MNLRHTAALALVSWYLMVPRPFPDSPLPQWEAPISEWDRYGDFASKAKCDAKQAKMIQDAEDPKTCAELLHKAHQTVPEIPIDMLCARTEEYIDISQCVAGDDPRFQGQVPPRVDHCCGTSAPAKQPQ
jgi:hypothetical protein